MGRITRDSVGTMSGCPTNSLNSVRRSSAPNGSIAYRTLPALTVWWVLSGVTVNRFRQHRRHTPSRPLPPRALPASRARLILTRHFKCNSGCGPPSDPLPPAPLLPPFFTVRWCRLHGASRQHEGHDQQAKSARYPADYNRDRRSPCVVHNKYPSCYYDKKIFGTIVPNIYIWYINPKY